MNTTSLQSKEKDSATESLTLNLESERGSIRISRSTYSAPVFLQTCHNDWVT